MEAGAAVVANQAVTVAQQAVEVPTVGAVGAGAREVARVGAEARE
jgi:hypothetical protein